MNKHLLYCRYVIRHKWFVFQACCRRGIPLAGIVHDWSKLLPDEWGPYAENFYGPKWPSIYEYEGEGRNWALGSGCYKEHVREEFDRAWLKHIHRNPHHWQWWVLREDSGKVKVLEMTDRYRREMLADWDGAGQAITGKVDTKNWYLKNRDKITLAPNTKAWVEAELGIQE